VNSSTVHYPPIYHPSIRLSSIHRPFSIQLSSVRSFIPHPPSIIDHLSSIRSFIPPASIPSLHFHPDSIIHPLIIHPFVSSSSLTKKAPKWLTIEKGLINSKKSPQKQTNPNIGPISQSLLHNLLKGYIRDNLYWWKSGFFSNFVMSKTWENSPKIK